MMKVKYWKVYISILLLSMMVPISARAAVSKTMETGQEKNYIDGEALVLYRGQLASLKVFGGSGSSDTDIQIVETLEFDEADEEISAKKGISNFEESSKTLKVSLVRSDTYSTEELVERLNARGDILAAEPNYQIHTLGAERDPYAKFQWAIDNQGQNHGEIGLDINSDQEIFEIDPSDRECVIALVDTGIDYTHEDLKNVVWNNPILANQLRGRHGYDFINQDADPLDDNGHGSHCSGIMAAAFNGVGIEGVAKSKNIKIMALKILDSDGYGYEMGAANAYHYIYKAQQLGIRVVAVNNSWGGVDSEESVILKTLIDLVGMNGAVSVCAAGNDASDNDINMELPSGFDSKYLISVAASNEMDELAAFSNYGVENVDIAAPGTDILSTVSYDCFNPGIYEDKEEICSVFEDFTDGNLVQDNAVSDGTIAYGLLKRGGEAELLMELSHEAYFGPKGDAEKSLKWSINGAKEGESYTLYFPYTANVSNTSLFDSIMVKAVGPKSFGEHQEEVSSSVVINDLKMKEDGSIEQTDEIDLLLDSLGVVNADGGNYWNHISGEGISKVNEEHKRALAVTLIVSVDGDYEIYLDHMGISKENTEPENFGKYDYYNGTSMAAPHVTGAAAAIANVFSEEDAQDLAAHLLGCVRNSSALDGLVGSGGVLDLSYVNTPGAYLRDVTLNANKEICIEGKYLNDAVVVINGKTVTPKKQLENQIILDSAGFLNHSLEITVTAGEKVLYARCFFASGAEFKAAGSAWGNMDGGFAVSDGEQIYYVSADGMVSSCMPNEKYDDGSIVWADGMYSYVPEIFGENSNFVTDYSISNLSDVIFLDGKLWTVLRLDMKYAEENILACYDEIKGWKMASELPEKFENLEGISIAAYQGKLYLLGGLDRSTGNAAAYVMRMDPSTGKWENMQNLPEGRAFAKAVSTGDKLIVALGRNNEESIPKTIVFDGTNYRISKADLQVGTVNNTYSYYNDEMELRTVDYYTGWVGAVKGGIICAGLQAENLGDTFFYQLSSDQYIPTGYSISNAQTKESVQIQAVGVQNQFYLMTQKNGLLSGMVIDGENAEEGSVHIFAMPVQSPCIEVNLSGMENGYLEGGYVTGARHYMPGDVISLEADAEEGYFVKSFTVNGANIPKDNNGKYRYRFPVYMLGTKVTVDVKFGMYVLAIILEESVTLSPGESYQMETYIEPETADNPRLIWHSDNPKAVSVDQNGVLTAQKTAETGAKAVITATAADRGEIQAACEVAIEAAGLPEVHTTKVFGMLKYKVIRSSEKTRTAACIGFSKGASKKAVQKVVIPPTIEIDGYTFRVTKIAKQAFANKAKLKTIVIGKHIKSIGQNAFLNCKSLKRIRINGKKLKTMGKNAFGGVGKKAVVYVPKKLKKSYAKKLKNAGYQGAIKQR